MIKSLHHHPLVDKLVNGPALYKFGASFKCALAVPERPKINTICSFGPLNIQTPLRVHLHSSLQGLAFFL